MIEVLVLHERAGSRIGIADPDTHPASHTARQSSIAKHTSSTPGRPIGSRRVSVENVGHSDLAGDEPQPPNLARRRRVRRTGARAGVRPCRGAACAYIYDACTKIAIINPSTHASISIKRPRAKFRCQSPASPILAHKIPPPKFSEFGIKQLILLVFWLFGTLSGRRKSRFPCYQGRHCYSAARCGRCTRLRQSPIATIGSPAVERGLFHRRINGAKSSSGSFTQTNGMPC
jgi:hypothetical protein